MTWSLSHLICEALKIGPMWSHQRSFTVGSKIVNQIKCEIKLKEQKRIEWNQNAMERAIDSDTGKMPKLFDDVNSRLAKRFEVLPLVQSNGQT